MEEIAKIGLTYDVFVWVGFQCFLKICSPNKTSGFFGGYLPGQTLVAQHTAAQQRYRKNQKLTAAISQAAQKSREEIHNM